MAPVSRKVAETASPRETEVKFLDPPVEGGVMYVLASRGDRIYTVDLNKLTCDCPQFSSTKQGMAPNQVQKYCTHLFRQARRKDFCKSLFPNHELVSEYFDHLEHSGFAIGDKFFLSKIAHNDVLVVQKADTSWVDVLTRKKTAKDATVCGGEIGWYGYNAPANRWSYGDAPFNPMQVKNSIRSLPEMTSIPSTSSNHEEVGFDFPLQEFLKLDPLRGSVDERLIDEIFAHLRTVAQANPIEISLAKLRAFQCVDRKRLASEWYEHGQNLQSQGNDKAGLFLRMARETDPKIAKKVELALASSPSLQAKSSGNRSNLKSVAETKKAEYENKRARLARITRDLLNIDAEEIRFNQLPGTRQKRNAEVLLKTKNPEWYSRSAGHTFRGYLYADFVRDSVSRVGSKPLKEKDVAVLDYMASLAIDDGTISDFVMAQMLRIKGEFAVERHDRELAIKLFRQAFAYSPNIGVKGVLKRLELNDKP
jgi:hypothetical protein